MKKSLSVLLSILMAFSAFSVMPFNALAADPDAVGLSVNRATKKDPSLTFEYDEYIGYGNNVVLNASVDKNATGIILFNIGDSAYYSPINDGKAQLTASGFEPYEYSVSAAYPGDSEFDSDREEGYLEVCPKCGDDVYYYYTDNGETLNLFGSGDTYDYEYISWTPDTPFYQNEEITTINVGNGITRVGANLFNGCQNVTSVTLPDGLVSIGNGAFSVLKSLESVAIPETVSNIEAYAFSNCQKLKSVTVPEGVTTISARTFLNCESLENLTLPKNVTEVKEYAFNGAGIKNLFVPSGVDISDSYIDSAANVWRYEALADQTGAPAGKTSVTITSHDQGTATTVPCNMNDDRYVVKSVAVDGVTLKHTFNGDTCTVCGAAKPTPGIIVSVEDSYLSGEKTIVVVNVSDNANGTVSATVNGKEYTAAVSDGIANFDVDPQPVGNYTFTVSYSGDSVHAPATSNPVSFYVYGQCGDNAYYRLTGENNEKLIIFGTGDIWDYDYFTNKSPFNDKTNIYWVVIEDGITGIGKDLFFECGDIESVSLPSSLNKVGAYAFEDCPYYCPVLPEGLVTIADYAFKSCAYNTNAAGAKYSLFIPTTVTSIGKKAFNGFHDIHNIFVPESISYNGDTFSGYYDYDTFNVWKYSVSADQSGAPEGTIFIDVKSREGTENSNTIPCAITNGKTKYVIKSVEVSGVTFSHDYDGYTCTLCGDVKEVTSVRNYTDLKELARQVNAGNDYAGKTVTLENDIVCKNDESDTDYATDWTPIGTESNPFKGTFDGKGYTITGLSNSGVSSKPEYVGMFGCTKNATIKNLGMVNETLSSDNYVGGIVAQSVNSKIENCYLTKGSLSLSAMKSGPLSCGGIVGKSVNSTVENCYSANSLSLTVHEWYWAYCGGIVGNSDETSVIKNCYHSGSFSSSGGGCGLGGIAGQNKGKVESCYNTSELRGTGTGPFVGGIAADNKDTGQIVNCYNKGLISASGREPTAGGIASSNDGTIRSCYNTGSVIGIASNFCYCGGIAHQNAGEGKIINCYNTGDISCSGSSKRAGGIVALNSALLENCYNTGKISSSGDDSRLGGLIGFSDKDTKCQNCYSAGLVKNDGPNDYCGGLVGFIFNESEYAYCYYDNSFCPDVGAVGSGSRFEYYHSDKVVGLTTAQMTGTNALNKMEFAYGTGETSPWLTKADGADGKGNYYFYYPHLTGFDFKDTDGRRVDYPFETGVQMTPDDIEPAYWPAKAEVSITWNGDDSYTYDGTTKRIVPTSVKVNNVELTAGEGYGVKYMKNNAGNWVETNDTINAGEYRTVVFFLKAVVEDEVIKYITDDSHSEITKDFEINPKSLSNASIRLSAASTTYNGNSIAQPLVESVTDGENSLVLDTDYTVSYTEGDWKDAGTYKVTVTGKGNYKDSVEATFEIKKKALTVTAKDRTYTYNGSAQGENNKTYTTDLDSKVEVSGLQGSDKLTSITLNGQETNAGTYNDRIVASAAAIGNATANYDITYIAGKLTIDQKPITITVNGNSKEVTYNGGEQTFNGTFTPTSSDTMFDASKFSYAGSTSVSGTNVDTYTLAPVEGNAAYNDNNFEASFVAGDPVKLTINKANANVTVVGNNNTSEYDEKEHVVTDYVATSDNDLYDVSKFFTFSGIAEAKRTKVGTTAMGLNINQFTNINVNFNVTFNVTDGYQEIVSKTVDPTALDVTLDDITYDGTAKDPVVKAGDTVLKPDEDYTITYKDADGNTVDTINGAGEYTVTITGKGNYSGEVTKTVKVEPKAITITAEDKKSTLGDALAELTYKVDGAVAGDELNVKLSTTADANVAGEYDITVTAENANYTITLVNGKYTVVDKVLPSEKEAAEEAINAAAKGTSSAKAVTIYWGKVKKADKIVVYAAYCGKNHRGKYKKIATLKGDATKYDITKLNGKKLNQKKNVKAYVVAYRKVNGKYKKITKSLKLHVAGYKSKRTNTKAIKLKKSKFTLKKGKTAKIKGSIVLEDSSKKAVNHVRKLRFKSSNKKVATVTRSGKIKAKGKGTCTIYVFANNGKAKKVKVTVK